MYLHFPNRREFLWLQEPDASKDADLVRRFNEIVNGPPENAGGELGAEFGEWMSEPRVVTSTYTILLKVSRRALVVVCQ